MKIDFDKMGGLIPVVIQDYKTQKVLMVGFQNKEAYDKTLETKKVHYFSRTKNKLWMKGGSSGHTQEVKEIIVDCDNDTLLIKAKQNGGACHKGYDSCFYKKLNGEIVGKKVFDPNKVYK